MTSSGKPPRLPRPGAAAGAYDVGYRKPPAASRFQPGRSGNPKGRPKGRKNRLPALNEERMKLIVLEEAYRDIKVADGDRVVTIPMAKAVMRSLAVAAAKGQARAQKLFTELLVMTESANKRLHDEWLETAIEFKVEWEKEFRRCDALGLPRPAPIPHPDDIVIDMKAGAVRVKGPFTKEEKVVWDRLRARKGECDAAIAAYRTDLANETDPAIRKIIEGEIEFETKLKERIGTVITD